MGQQLAGKKVAFLVTDGFEQVELTGPRQAIEDEGAQTTLVSPATGWVKGWNKTDWGEEFPVQLALSEANVEQFDALVLPGGVMNPDKLRRDETALRFVKSFFEANKPVAAICHGPWTLIDAGVIKGRTVTSYASIQTDLKNAGAEWVDREVVVDGQLITSRKPDDIPAFNEKTIAVIAQGGAAGAKAK